MATQHLAYYLCNFMTCGDKKIKQEKGEMIND